jgi:hypothetical protein
MAANLKMAVFRVAFRVVGWKFTDVSEVLAASFIRTSTSVMSVEFYQTAWRNKTEDSLVHTTL